MGKRCLLWPAKKKAPPPYRVVRLIKVYACLFYVAVPHYHWNRRGIRHRTYRRFAFRDRSKVLLASPANATWGGQNRMIPYRGWYDWKQSRSDNILHRYTGRPASANVYAGLPGPNGIPHLLLLWTLVVSCDAQAIYSFVNLYTAIVGIMTSSNSKISTNA